MEELQIDSITSFGAGALAGSSKGHFRLIGVDVRWDNQARKAIVTFPYVPDLVSENQTLRDNLQDSLSYLQVLDNPEMQALVTTIRR